MMAILRTSKRIEQKVKERNWKFTIPVN
jgi:ribosomal protein L39E